MRSRLGPYEGPEGTNRLLYMSAADPEGLFPYGRLGPAQLRAELAHARTEPVPEQAAPGPAGPSGDPAGTEPDDPAAWAAREAARFRALYARADGAAREVLVHKAVLGCAPLALLSGAWLQWLSDPGNADDPETLHLLTRYAQDVGVGHPRASRGSAWLELLRKLHLSEQAVPASRLSFDRRIADGCFRLPAVLLTMSRFPETFRYEIIGADRCLRAVGLLPALGFVRDALPDAADWDALDLGTTRDATVAGRPEDGGADGAPVRAADGAAVGRGHAWALWALRQWSDALHDALCASLDPAHDMRELLRQRAREGAVYHHDFPLQGRPLAQWLAECVTDPGPLLAALSTSRLIRPGAPDRSPLVNALIGERGPMFRVFSPDDVAVIRRWIASLGASRDADSSDAGSLAPSPVPAPAAALPALPALSAGAGDEGRVPADIREAYHLLQKRADTPALRRFALDHTRRWLAATRLGARRGGLPLPDRWAPGGLRPWLLDQHDRHGAEFEETARVPLPSREELIDSTVQLAPLTLIDGSWIRGFTDYAEATSDVGHFLFATYWDELGNGEVKLNHPLIYREVLAEMDVRLPPTGSPEFARWPGFQDESFALPVYWLSIGRFPRTFLPEVLGLNLAMELSGVGGSYRRGRLALRAYGFSTRFVDIHNTIDNVATGHSAWAADAIDTYLATLPADDREGIRGRAWERIRTGYLSLQPPGGLRARRVRRMPRGRRRHGFPTA
ncbi:iron-containing redox enzyme family protein [Streptomyces sp. NBC_01525]|uniref:iron-containing redox enzyme family protein n=1 Tax=Streptomyces sp. NBC_01525 TaxID=2903893 RepID=UPI00386B5653